MVHSLSLYYSTFHGEVNNMDQKDLHQMALCIKEKRKSYGYTQAEMAEQLGLSYSYYTKIENGLQTPSLDTLVRIAAALHLSMDRLIFGKGRASYPFSPDTQDFLQFVAQCNREELIRCRNLLNKIISFLG